MNLLRVGSFKGPPGTALCLSGFCAQNVTVRQPLSAKLLVVLSVSSVSAYTAGPLGEALGTEAAAPASIQAGPSSWDWLASG